MTPSTPWLLPEYIEDILPGEALALEHLRRKLIDHLATHGYQWISPPQLEYLDTLLTGTGQDLGLRTFKVIDQASGKTLGLRPDITPQAARIDAHLFSQQSINRLCYCGTVHHAKPSALHDSREIWQLGAELYGSAHTAADIEILQLLLELSEHAHLKNAHLDIGHIGLFSAITTDISDSLRQQLFECLQVKDFPALEILTAPLEITTRKALLSLGRLYGSPQEVLPRAREVFATFPEALAHLDDLDKIISTLNQSIVKLHIDLAELRGYHYHTGLVFALYTPTQHRAIALGGRYNLGEVHGHARHATGFSIDLRTLALCTPPTPTECIIAPYSPQDDSLTSIIKDLRQARRSVWVHLPEHIAEDTTTLPTELPAHATHRLVKENHQWMIYPLTH